jgi:hypothetical protein
MYYAPFDWINTNARVVVVGITPGRDSMLNAFRAAASALREGYSVEESSKRGKRAGSFSNMRHTISEMFDDLGLPEALGIRRSNELFGTGYDLIHPTSCVRYPVLVWREGKRKWVNYTGYTGCGKTQSASRNRANWGIENHSLRVGVVPRASWRDLFSAISANMSFSAACIAQSY